MYFYMICCKQNFHFIVKKTWQHCSAFYSTYFYNFDHSCASNSSHRFGSVDRNKHVQSLNWTVEHSQRDLDWRLFADLKITSLLMTPSCLLNQRQFPDWISCSHPVPSSETLTSLTQFTGRLQRLNKLRTTSVLRVCVSWQKVHSLLLLVHLSTFLPRLATGHSLPIVSHMEE